MVEFELLPPHPDSTVASPMTGTESRWRMAKPVKSVRRQISLEAHDRGGGWRLEALHILSPRRSVSAPCPTPEINANGASVGLGACLPGDSVLRPRLAQASPARYLRVNAAGAKRLTRGSARDFHDQGQVLQHVIHGKFQAHAHLLMIEIIDWDNRSILPSLLSMP